MLYTFSLPTKADKVPAGPDWLHEVKYDGYRMMLIREHGRVLLISRGGHDWARRFPLIVTAALKLRQEHFVIDGEAVGWNGRRGGRRRRLIGTARSQGGPPMRFPVCPLL
jgi:ATP-dependent DNA ligase